MNAITIEHLKYRYPGSDQLALDDISATIRQGEFIGIIGRNGAGKSTVSQAIMGLVPQFYKGAYGGKVNVCGLDAAKTPIYQLCEKVGLVFQNPFNQLSGAKETVEEEVAFGMQNLAIAPEEMQRRIDETLKLLEIDMLRDRNPFDLSGGQMQRVAIASILVMHPQVIILDEPTSQLDPQGTEEVFRVVDQLTNSGITIIMIEQKIEKLAHYCDRIMLMDQGRLVDFDTPARIFARDDLGSLGVKAPAYTEICKALHLTMEDGTYPVTVEQAARVIRRANLTPKQEKRESVHVTNPFYRVDKLRFAYTEGVDIIPDLSLQMDDVATAIVGQNGAGKTTFVKLLKGLLKPVGGNIYFRGEDISEKTVAMLAGTVGYVFQNPDDQIFKYKVIDEVMFGPLNIGMKPAEAAESARKALAMCGMEGMEQMNPYDLELHQRKMVAIASVLAMNTEVLILDEPTIAQDVEGRAKIGEIIRTLREQGRLVIAILHDMDFVAEYFDRVIVLTKGQVLADGNPAEVFAQDDVLKKARLQKPYVTQLCTELGLEGVYLTVEDLLRQMDTAGGKA